MTSTIRTVLLNDGLRIPMTAYGCGGAQYGRNVQSLVRQAIASGITHFDGAQAYGNEDSLGAGIATSGVPRSSLFVTTKLNRIPRGGDVRSSLESSLRKLGTSYVDLFLIHSPAGHRDDAGYGNGEKGSALRRVWNEMMHVKEQGLARSIGVSNFTKADLEIILNETNVVPSINQIDFHANIEATNRETYQFCRSHGIAVSAYGVLSPLHRSQTGPVHSAIAKLRATAKWANVSENQVLLKWAHAKNIVSVTTTTKEDRMREMAATLAESFPEMTAEEVQLIDDAGETRDASRY